MLDVIYYALGAFSGIIVGLTLGLVGGGGSILAVPLMVYLVGVESAHVAIGTSAFAVAANALTALASHAKQGTVKWRCGAIYASTGVVGALGGSTLGKAVDGQKLLVLFAILMIVIAVLMLRNRAAVGEPDAQCHRGNVKKVVGYGLGTGVFSGFFGIGGGFLIVPGLMTSTRMPTINAVGTSLIAVAAFGMTTGVNYASSSLVDWMLAIAFIVGGAVGAQFGSRAARHLSSKGTLTTVFVGLIIIVAVYMLWKTFA